MRGQAREAGTEPQEKHLSKPILRPRKLPAVGRRNVIAEGRFQLQGRIKIFDLFGVFRGKS